MININSLPKKVQTQLKNDPFIFTAANGRQVNINYLSAIVNSDDLINVIQVLPRQQYDSGYYPFFLQHTELFNKAQDLFESIFGLEPDLLIYSYKNDFRVSIFLFANKSLIEKSILKEKIEISSKEIKENIKNYKSQINKEEANGVKVDNIKIDNNSVLFNLPVGVFPLIGSLNSVDSGWRTPNFNLIFGSESLKNLNVIDRLPEFEQYNAPIDKIAKQEKEPEWVSNIDDYIISNFKHGISLYSIDKFDFKFENELNQFYNPNNMNSFYENSIIKAKIKFIDTIFSFLLAINRGSYLPISNDQFSAFIPHFYEFDRLAESVANYDSFEKRKLKTLYDTSLSFARSINNLTCKDFIDYFLRDSIINFSSLKIDPGKEILKAFEKQPQIPLLIGARKEILSRFITNGLPNTKYNRFLNGSDGQVEGKTKVYPLL